jgi:hypothetical protein
MVANLGMDIKRFRMVSLCQLQRYLHILRS